MMKQKNTKGVTPVGEVLFAHILKTEIIKEKDTGKFSIMLKLSEKEKKAFLAKINDEWEKFKDTLAGKKLKYDPSFGLKEYQEVEYFKFTSNETIKLKSGEILKRTVPIYDAKQQEISKKLNGIGNGSKVKIAYELVPFYMNDKSYGISLRLSAVQLLDLVEFGAQSAESFGFGVEEGYTADESVEEQEETLDTPEEIDDEEGDF